MRTGQRRGPLSTAGDAWQRSSFPRASRTIAMVLAAHIQLHSQSQSRINSGASKPNRLYPMAKTTKNDAHVVEISVTGDAAGPAGGGAFLEKAAAGHRPLREIAESGSHVLLLKLWQREESRLGRHACALEALMDATRRDAFNLYTAFLALHGLPLALLFAASMAGESAAPDPPLRTCACRRWWVPSSLWLDPPSRSPLPCSSWCAPTGTPRSGCGESVATPGPSRGACRSCA